MLQKIFHRTFASKQKQPCLTVEICGGCFGAGTARIAYDALLLPERIILFNDIEELSIDGLNMVHSAFGPPTWVWGTTTALLMPMAWIIARHTCIGDCLEVSFTATMRNGKSFHAKAEGEAFYALKRGFLNEGSEIADL